MKIETKIVTILMCAALALSACNKKLPDTSVEEQQLPVGFSAKSQAVWVKSGETTAMFPYDDFGVWGIARQGTDVYNLWGNTTLAEVLDLEHRIENNITQSATSRVFTPAVPAYWFNGYDYNFLAVAPYDDEGFALTEVVTEEAQTSVTNAKDYLTFTYDMSDKYEDTYTFDLLGAAAQHSVTNGGYKGTQDLTFWHLFTQISIQVLFPNITGTGAVSKLTLVNVDTKASYSIKYNEGATGSTGTLSVLMNQITSPETSLEFSANSPKDDEGRWIAHIVPQNISNIVIKVDYAITEDGKTVYYNDSVSLANSSPAIYNSNDRYNWTLKINPKEPIGFHVQIADWSSEDLGNGGFDIL